MSYRNGRRTTEIEDIQYEMEQVNQTKWGYVIYRCTYSDDEAWNSLIEFLKTDTREWLKENNALDLAEKLDWKIVSDSQVLDGASTDQVRRLFAEWVGSEEARAEQTGAIYNAITTRQHFCVHVDAAALDSFVNRKIRNQKSGTWDYGWVNVVDGFWEVDPDCPPDEDDRLSNAGHMRVAVDSLLPSSYAYFDGSGQGAWYAVYQPPPYVWE
jgi:hypothetical protein